MIRLLVIAVGLLANSAAAQGLSLVRMTQICDEGGVIVRADAPQILAVTGAEDIAAAPDDDRAPLVGALPSVSGGDDRFTAETTQVQRFDVRLGFAVAWPPVISRVRVDGSDPSADFCP